MEIEYGLTLEDVEAFVRFNTKHGPKLKPQFFVRLLGYALGLAIVGLYGLSRWFWSQPETLWISGFCAGCIAGMLIIIFLAALLQKKLAVQGVSRFYNNKESRWSLAWRRLKITVDGFEITNEFEQQWSAWSVVWLIDSTDEYAFFYTTLHQAHIIPRRAFQNRRDFEAFIDRACQYHKGLPPRELASEVILDALPAQPTGITRPPNS